MDALDDRESSLKELPTREQKLKRHKDRRESPTIPPIRLRLKSSVSSMNSETDTEKCFSDRSVSSSPDSVSQEHSPVFITTYNNTLAERNSSPSSPEVSEYASEPHKTFHFGPSNYFECEDYDQPLDMSQKRTENNITSKDFPSRHVQQMRPSVITCASALLRTQCNLSDIAHNICTIQANCDANSNDIDDDDDDDGDGGGGSDNNRCLNWKKNNNNGEKSSRLGHRREIVSGSCDPVIDEHFRRSLGKEYQNIFSKSTGNNVSVTVDDHFAKALGETWHQLQQSKSHAATMPSEHSSSSIQAPPSSQFIHHSPEILS